MPGTNKPRARGLAPAPSLSEGCAVSGTASTLELDAHLGEMMRRLVRAAAPAEAWQVIVHAGLQVVPGADLSVLVGAGSSPAQVLAARGLDTEGWQGERMAVSAAVLDPVIRSGMHLVLPGVRLMVGRSVRVVSVLAVPVRLARDNPDVGALLVGRLRDRRAFTSTEIAPLEQVSRRTELAFDIATECLQHCDERMHQERADLALQAQRHIVAPLFAASMDLANLSGVTSPVVRPRLLDVVATIDAVTGWLRGQIQGR